MYLQKIKGNVKCGIADLSSTDRQYLTLGQKTLIYGENGSGKTTIVNGVELLLGGFATDVMGRGIVRSPSQLIALKGKDKPQATLQVKGIMSDGTHLSYELRKTEKGAGRPRHNGPSGLTVQFPMQEVQDILTGSIDGVRRWLSSKLPIEEYLEVNDDLREEIYAQQKADPNAPLSDILQNIKDTSKRKIKEAKSQIKATEIAKNMLGTISTPIEDHILEEMKKECDGLFEQIVSQSKMVNIHELRHEMVALKEFRSKYDACVSRLEQLADIQPLTKQERDEVTILTHLREVAKINKDRHNCFVCDGRLTDKALTVGQIEGVLVTVGQRLADTNERNTLLAEREDLDTKIKAQSDKVKSMRSSSTSINIDEIQRKYTATRERYEQLKNQHKAYTQALDLDAQIKDHKQTIKDQEQILFHAENQFSEALGQAVVSLQNRVNQYLRDNYEFLIDLSETTCRVGLKKFGEECFAVSGVEWIMLCMAVAAATIYNHEKVLNVFVIEDRALDEESLHVLMMLMQDIEGQVLMTTTLKPKLQIPNWLYIERYDIPF